MAAFAEPGRNPRVATASGQTLPDGTFIARVVWDYPSTTAAGTLILREGASASPSYICRLRAVANQPQTIVQEVHHLYRDVNVLTMTAGTCHIYSSYK